MDSQIISLIISWTVSLIAGGAGGTIVGALVKNRNLSPMLNTVLGAVGGGLGGKVLPMLIPAIGSLVGGTDSQRIPVGFTIRNDGADPELVAGTYDTDGDFATVRDENLAEHRPLSLQKPQLYAQSIP
jgi:uncharacterized membrane protein YeaQ/YmgE (transglycosylase-associated protein family)